MWVKEKPQHPGFYWYRCDWLGNAIVTAEPVQVKADQTVLLLGTEGVDSEDELTVRGEFWSEPLLSLDMQRLSLAPPSITSGRGSEYGYPHRSPRHRRRRHLLRQLLGVPPRQVRELDGHGVARQTRQSFFDDQGLHAWTRSYDRGADAGRVVASLQTDHLDLWQVHGVSYENDPDLFIRPNGAAEALRKAKEQGKVRFVGFTGHKRPDIHLKSLFWLAGEVLIAMVSGAELEGYVLLIAVALLYQCLADLVHPARCI